jgi:hypothetical protein
LSYDYNELKEEIDEDISKKLILRELDLPTFLMNENSTILVNLVTDKSFKLFKRFNITSDFLQIPPCKWKTNDDFLKADKIIKNFKVLNDAAERGIKLLQDFNESITKDDIQKTYLLQV